MKYHSLKDIESKVPKPGSFKHFLQIQEHGGRVVKGVNTTADVGVDAIKKQAAKFGNKVDKDGRTPTLSKKVKGSKTNVLFNLGLAESVDNTDESMLYYAKMAENLGELASTSKVYVDMDGVLADFFGEWKKLIGKDWRKVKDIEPALQKIRDTDDFWLDLPLLPQAKNLLGIIKKVKGSYTILSSPLPNDPNSEPHKREWIKKNLDFFPPENVIITSDKAKFATNADGTPNILIDDFGQNIASWEAAGGEGFKHKDHKFERTAKAIRKQFKEPVKEEILSEAWPAVFFVGRTLTFLARFIRLNPKTSLGLFSLPWTGPMLVTIGKAIAWLYKWGVPIGLGIVAIYGGKKLYNALKDKDPDTITEQELEQILRNYVPKSDDDLKGLVTERTLTKGEEKKKEKYVKGMKKAKGDFKDRYGKDADAVMYATATKMAKEALSSGLYTPDTVLELLENFADGKKSGKSRPGRVKRAGASCGSSVTELRKKAKNGSGERAKMYHWCANMKSGRKKKSESVAIDFEMINMLIESTDEQLHEGIKDSLAKLPKNVLAKVQPILKKIPKTGKSLVLIATLLGVMVNAAAAGDMGKVDAQVDKLNGMATQSTTMDQPTTADKGGFDLDKVNYDREYKGDVNKVFAVQDTSVKDAKAMYDKLGGVSDANYEKMKTIVYDKIDDLRTDYQNATAEKGLSGKDALKSDEFKDFRKQSNDLKIMLSKAMEIANKDAGETGQILKPTGKIIK